jgi:transposase-like protein
VFKRRTEAVGQLLPTLYLHGLAEGDFDLALRGLLGDGAPLSASSIARLKASWQAEYEAWTTRWLADLEPVYLWVDGVYVKAGLEKDKAAMLVVLAGLRDGPKVVLAVASGYRESTESWAALLRDLKARGLRPPRLVVGDGHLGIWGALTAVFPLARQQRCWNHRLLNVGVPTVGHVLDQDWDRLVAFYEFPKAHWKHLRTSNPIQSPFAAVRLRTAAAKRYKRVKPSQTTAERKAAA